MPDIGPTLAADLRRAEIDAAAGEALYAARGKSHWPTMRILRRSSAEVLIRLQEEPGTGGAKRIIIETRGDFKQGRDGEIPFVFRAHMELSDVTRMWTLLHGELKVFNMIQFFEPMSADRFSSPQGLMTVTTVEERHEDWPDLFSPA